MADPAVGNNSEIFDPTKEKKKKKKKVLDLDSVLLGGSASAAPPQEEDPSASLGGAGGPGDQDGAGNEDGGVVGGFDDIMGDLESFGSKKKKKKVKGKIIAVVDEEVILAEEVVGGGGAVGDEEGVDFDFSKKKKKKGKGALDDLVAGGDDGGEVVSIPTVTIVEWNDGDGDGERVVEEEQEVVVVVRGDDDDEVVVDREIGGDDDDDGTQAQQQDLTFDEDDEGVDGDEDAAAELLSSEQQPPAPQVKSWLSSDRDYTYDELLTRVFEIMRAKNPEMVTGTKQKFVMRPPQVVKVGTKKTSFVNFMEICKMLHRHQKHLLDFLLSELGTSGSIDGNNQLIIKGRFQQKQIENVLRRYIKEYVTCHTCKSPNTLLQKDFRLFFLQCEACGSRCSVASIKHGFQAVTGKRAAMRAKAN